MKGNPLESSKNFREKQKNRIFNVKSESRDPLGFFNIRSVAKYQNKLKGGPFEDIKKFSKKSQSRKKGGVS